jgi:hypothetical protein
VIALYQSLEVGKLFRPDVYSYPEQVQFEFEQSGPSLYIYFSQPTIKEIEAVRSGKFKIGFYETESIIFILVKFEGMNWIDAPYTVHLSPPFEFMEELDSSPMLGFGLQIFLVDAATGILKVIRYVGLGHDFSVRLRDGILRQKGIPFDKGTYGFRLNEIYRRYSTDQLVDYAKWFFKIE